MKKGLRQLVDRHRDRVVHLNQRPDEEGIKTGNHEWNSFFSWI